MVTTTRLSRRRILGFIAVSSLGALGVACGSVGSTPPAASPALSSPASAAPTSTPATAPAGAAIPAAGEPVEIAIATSWTGTAEKKIWDQLVGAFAKKHPSITLKLDLSSAQGAYDELLYAQLAAGTLPDIVLTSDNTAVPFKQHGVTRDMIPFAQATSFPYLDFDKSFLDLGMVEGQLHMLPRGGDVVVLFVNKKLAQAAGVEIPWKLDPATAQWTQDDFDAACKKLTVDATGKRFEDSGFDKNNVSVYGAAIANTWWAVYVPAVLSEGGEFVASDLSKSLLNNPGAVKAFDWLTRGKKAGYHAPISFLRSAGGDSGAWSSGKVAMMMTVRATIPSVRDKLTDDWDVAHFPRGSAKRVTGMGSFGFALTAASKHPEDAWSYLDWMYGEEGMTIIAQSYGSVPVQKRFARASFWRDLPAPPANNDVFVDAFAYGTLPPRLPFYTTGPFAQSIEDGMAAIEQGKSTPADVVKNVDETLTKWLALNKK